MPRIKPKRGKYDDLVSLMAGAKVLHGLTDDDLAAKTGMSTSTLCRRRRAPQDYTVEELSKLAMALKIPVEDMRAAAIRP